MQPFDVGAGDRAPMDEADLQAFGEVEQHPNSAWAHMCWQAARHVIGRAENKLCTERTQFRLSESCV
jgi:hypothetical protein